MGHMSNLSELDKRGLQNDFWGRKYQISCLVMRVRKEKRGCRERSSNFSLRSTKIRWSSSDKPRFKVGVLDKGYTWIPETPSFAKVSRGRFGKSKASSLGSARETSSGLCSRFKR